MFSIEFTVAEIQPQYNLCGYESFYPGLKHLISARNAFSGSLKKVVYNNEDFKLTRTYTLNLFETDIIGNPLFFETGKLSCWVNLSDDCNFNKYFVEKYLFIDAFESKLVFVIDKHKLFQEWIKQGCPVRGQKYFIC